MATVPGRLAGAAPRKASGVGSPRPSPAAPGVVSPSAAWLALSTTTGPWNATSGSDIELRLAAHIGGHRVGDETLLVGLGVQLHDILARRQVRAPEHPPRMQAEAHHGHA